MFYLIKNKVVLVILNTYFSFLSFVIQFQSKQTTRNSSYLYFLLAFIPLSLFLPTFFFLVHFHFTFKQSLIPFIYNLYKKILNFYFYYKFSTSIFSIHSPIFHVMNCQQIIYVKQNFIKIMYQLFLIKLKCH